MTKGIQPITDAELAVMKLLWQRTELTARQIRDELYPTGTSSDHGTVQKLLQRLEAKRFVSRDRSEFAHRFRARVSQQEYAGSEFQSLAKKLTGGSLVPVLTHLVEAEGISREELKELRKLFDVDRRKR